MLSKKAKYAIKALLALADNNGDEPVRIADLARAEQIPPKFLELILLGLKNQGMLQSRKGKGGRLSAGPGPWRDLPGPGGPNVRRPAGAGSLRQPDRLLRCADCKNEAVCGVHLAMKEVRDATARVLDGTSLASLRRKVDQIILPFHQIPDRSSAYQRPPWHAVCLFTLSSK